MLSSPGGMVHRILVATAVGLALSIGVTPAFAFCRTTTCASKRPPPECKTVARPRDPVTGCLAAGRPLSWEQRCVSFAIQGTPSMRLALPSAEVTAIVEQGFQAWPSASCGNGFPSITVTNLGTLECTRREFNPKGPNANAVIFVDGDWPYDERALALTTVSFDRNTGKIFGADMEINTGGYSLDAASLRYVVTHEAGHFFGLDHSADFESVMYEDYTPRGTGAGSGELMLNRDDIAAICTAYPPDRPVSPTCDPEPEGGYATDCGGDVVGSCALAAGPVARTGALPILGFGALLVFGARRRRRKLVVSAQRV